jgi:hypothetical protein
MAKMLIRKSQVLGLVDKIAALEAADAAEAARATGAEAQLTSDLAAEVARATAAEGVLTADLAAEVTRATGEEARIEGLLNNEVTRATGAEAQIAGDLAAEVTRATDEEARIEGKHDAYVTSNDAALAAEEAARLAADAGLQSQIDFIVSNTDPAAIDSLTEVVAAFQAADSNINGAITQLGSDASADRAAIRSEFAAADTALQADIDANEQAVDNRFAGMEEDKKVLTGATLEASGKYAFGPYTMPIKHVFGSSVHVNGLRVEKGVDWFLREVANNQYYIDMSSDYADELAAESGHSSSFILRMMLA